MPRLDRWSRLLGGVVLAWALVAGLSALRAALARPHDRMEEQEAEFRQLIPDLPARGAIGYLEPYNGFNDDTTREHFAAQYALAPRLIVAKPYYEFLIVANGAARPDGDPRLATFARVATYPGGHRLFRRFP